MSTSKAGTGCSVIWGVAKASRNVKEGMLGPAVRSCFIGAHLLGAILHFAAQKGSKAGRLYLVSRREEAFWAAELLL